MRNFLIIISLAGCGDCNNKMSPDAAIDMSLAPNCATYCSDIQTHCTGANAQYPNMDQCTQACALFIKGTSTVTDTAGNTLGCRSHYAAAASTMPSINCPNAGPAGDVITASVHGFCSGGDVCTSFCTLETAACGSLDSPLTNNPKDATGNPLFQFRNVDNCVTLCHNDHWDQTHAYSTMAMGDSLACRLSAAVTAALSLDSAKIFCAYTADFPTGQCAGTAMP
jgi:hypothetical protein